MIAHDRSWVLLVAWLVVAPTHHLCMLTVVLVERIVFVAIPLDTSLSLSAPVELFVVEPVGLGSIPYSERSHLDQSGSSSYCPF